MMAEESSIVLRCDDVDGEGEDGIPRHCGGRRRSGLSELPKRSAADVRR
jgi:hypothetical protein